MFGWRLAAHWGRDDIIKDIGHHRKLVTITIINKLTVGRREIERLGHFNILICVVALQMWIEIWSRFCQDTQLRRRYSMTNHNNARNSAPIFVTFDDFLSRLNCSYWKGDGIYYVRILSINALLHGSGEPVASCSLPERADCPCPSGKYGYLRHFVRIMLPTDLDTTNFPSRFGTPSESRFVQIEAS